MKASKEFLRKEGISETHPDFVALTQMLRNNSGYMYQFTKFRFYDQHNIVALRNLFALLQDNKQVVNTLEKPAASYTDYAELVVAMQNATKNASFNQFIQLCPSNLKPLVRKNSDNLSFNRAATSFMRYNKQQQRLFTSSISRYKTFAQLRVALSNFVDYVSNKKDLGSTINLVLKTPHAHIRHIDFENNYMVVRVAKRPAVVALGKGTQWCIADRNSGYWDTYIRRNNNEDIQYIIFDFNKPIHAVESIIGLTLQGNRFSHCHMKGNNALNNAKAYFKDLAYFDEKLLKPASKDGEFEAENIIDDVVSLKNIPINTWSTANKNSIKKLVETGYAPKLIDANFMSSGKLSKMFSEILINVEDEKVVSDLVYKLFSKIGDTKLFNEFIPILHNVDIKTFKKMKSNKLELKYGVHLDKILDTYFGSEGIMTTETKNVTRNGIKYRQTITLEPLNSMSLEVLDVLISTNPKIASNKALTFAFRKNNLELFKVILKHFTGKIQKVTQYNQIESFRNELVNSNKI